MSSAGQVIGGVVGTVAGFFLGPAGSYMGMLYAARIAMSTGEYIAAVPGAPNDSPAEEGE